MTVTYRAAGTVICAGCMLGPEGDARRVPAGVVVAQAGLPASWPVAREVWAVAAPNPGPLGASKGVVYEPRLTAAHENVAAIDDANLDCFGKRRRRDVDGAPGRGAGRTRHEANWQQPPFSGAIADGFVWGRGTMDTKGKLVAHLRSGRAPDPRGFQPTRTIYLVSATTKRSAAATARCRSRSAGRPTASASTGCSTRAARSARASCRASRRQSR